MSTDQPPPDQPPEDDPFSKRPPPPPPGGPPPGGQPPPGGPPPGSPYDSPYGGGSPYDNMPPPPPPYGSGYGGGYGGTDPLSGMPPLADTGRRILARLIDWVIIAVPLAIIGIPFDIYQRATRNGDGFDNTVNSLNGGSQLVFQLITIVAYIAYDTVLTAKNGQTIGKKLMKLRVAMLNDGTTPPMSQSLLRAVVLWLPALVCCACLWPLLLLILIMVDKPYKQGLHDKAAKTVVVTVPR
ncbi:RDD family protein [Streptomyces vietnamensis]|uniref:RDD domain-containing membrane protein n=1 Tax=Streptomyces vietnamensis TaxID=362257 RepID=A0A0B5I4T0_9ACTN|nr:RDD family protein [Streptomyces vietnamensis]AJF65412.1 RDD domain-containing membrane protein [Streptomyces vietnamensis]